MKITTKFLLLGLLIGLFLFPIIGVTANIEPKQAAKRFKLGLTGSPAEDWDIAITGAYGTVDLWMTPACTEYLYGLNDAYDRGISDGVYKSETYIPVLATDWDFDFWPEENNSKGFFNRGGVANITFTLRDGVTFHDGSAWNATVAKFNIDRVYIITGNLTGNGDLRNRDTYWVDANDWVDYYTPSWNMSDFLGGYGYYDGHINPNPYGGIDPISGKPIHYAPYEMYPIVKRVVIVDDQPSGGTIRIEFNDFNTYSMSSVGNIKYISMAAYGEFWDKGIYGYDNNDPLYPDHLIGTGPYKYVNYDETGSPGGGTLAKNLNYWNRTGLEARGWFDADYIDIVVWPAGTLGTESRNTALMTNAIDYALDNFFTPVDYQDVLSEPRLNYIERPESDYV
ncbi:MAG: ABC transporter substrate-binding protein, partial [Promethearchaeota archaeon]